MVQVGRGTAPSAAWHSHISDLNIAKTQEISLGNDPRGCSSPLKIPYPKEVEHHGAAEGKARRDPHSPFCDSKRLCCPSWASRGLPALGGSRWLRGMYDG